MADLLKQVQATNISELTHAGNCEPGYDAQPQADTLSVSVLHPADITSLQLGLPDSSQSMPLNWPSTGSYTAGLGLIQNYPNSLSVGNLSGGIGTFTLPNSQPWLTTANHSGLSTKIDLTGPEADIMINQVSLVDTLRGIQERLNILVPNPDLEKEWDQLRALGEQYRAMEIKLQEQGDMWAKLKAMPPPDIG